jgi:hypothetical protein
MTGSTALVRGDKHLQAVVEGDRTLPGEGLGAEELAEQQEAGELGADRAMEDTLITLSRESYYSSKTWWDSSIRAQIERNLRAYNNRHPPGSKYYTEQYRKKSKIFRPKTRTAIRKSAAATAKAFFSSSDVVHCSPVNPADDAQVMAAELHMALINFRMQQKETYWYQTVVGGITDADTTGVVISKQDWRFTTTKRQYEERYLDEVGEEFKQIVEEEHPLEDRPQVSLIPIENMRFDPACDWRDPINTSPYLIEMVPMYIDDIQMLQQKINPVTGQPHYKPVIEGMLAASIHQDWDSVRKAREGERIDKYDNDTMVRAHQSVWVHKHIMKIGGQDYCWDTIGSEILLTDMQPLEDVYLTGSRPYVMGYSNIEPHKIYPAGKPELIDGLQEETNDVANLRLDNVKLALNKRYFAKRGAGIDIRSLVRNVAGSVTMMGNPATDIKVSDTPDVTGSSYEEQDRINVDIDDLLGDFNAGSVQSNKSLNETVGGMEMMGASAGVITEFDIRTFAETWYEPVLRQLVELEAAYETDEAVLHVAGGQAGFEDIEAMLQVITQPVRVKVNVGFDATNPEKRIQRLAFGLNAIQTFAPDLAEKVDGAELVKEVFGALGYADGVRFFPSLSVEGEDPRVLELQDQVEQLIQIIESKKAEKQIEGEIKLAGINMTIEGRLAEAQMKYEVQIMLAANQDNIQGAIAQMKDRLEQIDQMVKVELSKIKRQELFLQREALSHEIQEADRRFQVESAGGKLPEGGAFNLPGEDKAGVISRDRYGMVPSMAEGPPT